MKTGMACLIAMALAATPATAALARTQPNDLVRVIKAKDEALDWQVYDKKFRDLKFDRQTLERIKAVENRLAQGEYNAASRYRLTNVRIVAEQVQSLLFRNELGDVELVDLYKSGDAGCHLTFSGNGFSRCSD